MEQEDKKYIQLDPSELEELRDIIFDIKRESSDLQILLDERYKEIKRKMTPERSLTVTYLQLNESIKNNADLLCRFANKWDDFLRNE